MYDWLSKGSSAFRSAMLKGGRPGPAKRGTSVLFAISDS